MSRTITIQEGPKQMIVSVVHLEDGRNQIEVTGDFSFEVDGMQLEGDSEDYGEEGGTNEAGSHQPLG